MFAKKATVKPPKYVPSIESDPTNESNVQQVFGHNAKLLTSEMARRIIYPTHCYAIVGQHFSYTLGTLTKFTVADRLTCVEKLKLMSFDQEMGEMKVEDDELVEFTLNEYLGEMTVGSGADPVFVFVM